MNIILYIVEMLVCFLLQSTVFSEIFPTGTAADLVVIVVVATGYTSGCNAGMFMGLFGGFLMDVQFGELFGVYGLACVFIGYGCGLLSKYYVRYDTLFPACVTAVCEFLFAFYSYMVNALVYGDLALGYYMVHVILPKTTVTVIISVFLYKLLDFLYLNICLGGESDSEEEYVIR